MYTPEAFVVDDIPTLHAAIEANSFAVLVSQKDEFAASHLPLLLERDSGAFGTLVGHMARANPQWRSASGRSVLAIFSGPHAYVSPSWYQAENVVPTWNYVAVHACGTFEPIEDHDALREIVGRTVEFYERRMPQPWRFEPDSAFNEKLLGAIVGFRIEIRRLEGKWKLSQNHPPERRERVVRSLENQEDANSLAVARLMADRP